MIPCEEEADFAAIAMADHINRADTKLLYEGCGFLCHVVVRKRLFVIRAMTVPPPIDTDDFARGCEVVPLLCKAVVEKNYAAMKEDDRGATAVCLHIKLGAMYHVEAMRLSNTSVSKTWSRDAYACNA